jgi:hypothetical protein
MGIERSEIAAEGTIKAEMHKTPTTECVQQLFDARCLCEVPALLILHEIAGRSVETGPQRVRVLNLKSIAIIVLDGFSHFRIGKRIFTNFALFSQHWRERCVDASAIQKFATIRSKRYATKELHRIAALAKCNQSVAFCRRGFLCVDLAVTTEF